MRYENNAYISCSRLHSKSKRAGGVGPIECEWSREMRCQRPDGIEYCTSKATNCPTHGDPPLCTASEVTEDPLRMPSKSRLDRFSVSPLSLILARIACHERPESSKRAPHSLPSAPCGAFFVLWSVHGLPVAALSNPRCAALEAKTKTRGIFQMFSPTGLVTQLVHRRCVRSVPWRGSSPWNIDGR